MRFILLLCLLLGSSKAWAQFDTGEVNSTLITYSRHIPITVQRSMPRGSKSLYWGQFTPGSGKSSMAVHVFAPPRKLKNRHSKLYTYFEEIQVFSRKNNSFVRINRVTRSFDSDEYFKVADWKRKMHFLWLDQQGKRTPIVTLDEIAKESALPVPYGTTTFFIFNSTWKAPMRFQFFGYGSSDNGSFCSYKLARNAEGELEVIDTSGDASGTSTNLYRWDSKEFSVDPTKSTFRSNIE